MKKSKKVAVNFIMQATGTIVPKFDDEKTSIFSLITPNFRTVLGAVYGIYEGIPFAVSPQYDEFRGQFERAFEYVVNEKNRKVKIWKEMALDKMPKVAEFLKKNSVLLKHYRTTGQMKSSKELREFKKMASMQANAEGALRYRKGQSNRRSLPTMSSEYQHRGTLKYGKHIEMNGKSVYMGKAMIQYMDGNGSGLRPLDTGCFIGSGHKIKFAKASQD